MLSTFDDNDIVRSLNFCGWVMVKLRLHGCYFFDTALYFVSVICPQLISYMQHNM